jgi:DNA-binding response OmpR family regulator
MFSANTASLLGTQERALLAALVDCQGRVAGRRELSRLAGMHDLNERRCDSLLVAVRRVLGPNSVRTVRSRGWMLSPEYLEQARLIVEN